MPLASGAALLLFSLPALISLPCIPATISVPASDSRLVYAGWGYGEGGGIFSNPWGVGIACTYPYAVTTFKDSSVSLNFTGTDVQYSFFAHQLGSFVQIILDGKQVDLINTREVGTVPDVICDLVTGFIAVPNGIHEVTAINEGFQNYPSAMRFQGFAYTPSSASANSYTIQSAPTATWPSSTMGTLGNNSSPSSSHTAAIAGSVAGVVGLMLLTIVAVFYRRRQRYARDVRAFHAEAETNEPLSEGILYQHDQPINPEHAIIPPPKPRNVSPPTFPEPSSSSAPPESPRQQVHSEPDITSVASTSRPTRRSGSSWLVDPAYIRNLFQQGIPAVDIAASIRAMLSGHEGPSTSGGAEQASTTAPVEHDSASKGSVSA
ncbi:hypothetical protein FRB93_005303 [Tulasnella sp. JGI-2019a]|nr:hypothetical protein FRB93_005303 [Tulasnella sp. JGI-2019a]